MASVWGISISSLPFFGAQKRIAFQLHDEFDFIKPTRLILRGRNNIVKSRPKMPVLNGYLNIVEAAEVLGIHPGTVKRLCREKKIVAEKVHNGWLIHNHAVQSFSKVYRSRRGRPSNDTSQQPHLRD